MVGWEDGQTSLKLLRVDQSYTFGLRYASVIHHCVLVATEVHI